MIKVIATLNRIEEKMGKSEQLSMESSVFICK